MLASIWENAEPQGWSRHYQDSLCLSQFTAYQYLFNNDLPWHPKSQSKRKLNNNLWETYYINSVSLGLILLRGLWKRRIMDAGLG